MRRTSKAMLYFVLSLTCLVVLLRAGVLQVASGAWVPFGSMAAARAGASAALLQDGRILLTGGDGGSGPTNTAEFLGTDGTFSPAVPMSVARSNHIAVVLRDGRLLVAGGVTSGGGVTNAAEIYEPSGGSWATVAGGMNEARAAATTALLLDGRVLIVGGQNAGGTSSTVEIFDPVANVFSLAGTLSSPRQQQATALLHNGVVLIIGGSNGTNPLQSSDIFDPVAGTISAGPALSVPRMDLSATTLLDGRVLVAGGNNGSVDLASAEICDAGASAFTASNSSLATARSGHQAFLLPNNNNVLIVGGTSNGSATAAAEIFLPWGGTGTGIFQATGAMSTPRSAATGSRMQQRGLLWVAGGKDASGNALTSTEVYGFANVQTDQEKYAPGQFVTITGSGWQPGETVTLSFLESPAIDTHPTLTAVADSSGDILNIQFSLDSYDVKVLFFLTATGSNSQAQTTFAVAPSGGSGQPQLSATPTSIDFGNVTVGSNGTQAVTLANSGTASLTILQASGSGSGFSLSGLTTPLILTPGQSSAVTLQFAPLAVGGVTGSISLVSNAPNSPTTLALNGTGVVPVVQLITASPTSLSFGNVTVGSSSTQTVTLSNSGNSSVTIFQIGMSGASFSNGGLTPPLILTSGQATALSVSFAPASAGSGTGSVSVISNATNSPATVALSGSGVQPVSHSVVISWDPATSAVVGYNLYRGTQSGGPYTKLNSSLILTATYTDSTVQAGQTYFYVATAAGSNNVESDFSIEIPATIPTP